jgi:hypothetical protein
VNIAAPIVTIRGAQFRETPVIALGLTMRHEQAQGEQRLQDFRGVIRMS